MKLIPDQSPARPVPGSPGLTLADWLANAPALAEATGKVGPRFIRRYGTMLAGASPALAAAVRERAAGDADCRRLADSPGEGEGSALALAVGLLWRERPTLFDFERLMDVRLADLARADLRQPGGFIAGLLSDRERRATPAR